MNVNETRYLRRQGRRFKLLEEINVRTFPTIIQSNAALGLSVAMASNVTAGNVLIVPVGWFNSNVVPTMSDTLGTNYTLIKFAIYAGGPTYLGIFVGKLKTSGACTITAVAAGSTFSQIVAVEFSNLLGLAQSINIASSINTSPTCSITGYGLAIAAIEAFHSGTAWTATYPINIIKQVNGSDAIGIAIIDNIHGNSRTFSFGGTSLDNWNMIEATII